MQIRPTAFTIGLIIYSFIALFFVYTEFGIDSYKMLAAFIAATIIILPLTFLKYYDSFATFTFNYGALLALIPVQLYSGNRERSSTPLKKKINRWFFYVYYPLHLMIIFIIE